MKGRRKFFIIFSIIMIFTLPRTYAMVIHEESSIEEISPSISYIEKTQFNTNKWIVIKSLIVDIQDEKTSIEPLFNPNNLQEAKKMSELVQTKENILAGINGDFFNYSEKTAIGPLIDKSKMIYNGTYDPAFNVFGISNINKPFIGNIKKFMPDVMIGKTIIPVNYLNKNYTHLNNIVLFNNAYGKISIGNSTGVELTEVVIEKDRVVDIRTNQPPISIPEDGYIIAIPNSTNFNISQISIGDNFVFTEPKILDALNTLIGGGSILVEKGQLNSDFSLPIKGNHPRTAIGFTEDYSKVILTTVEGRKTFVPGVTETELAKIMMDLGAYYAINLDGGGSSTLIKRDFGKVSYHPTNHLSDGVERRVYNGIGIASNYETNEIHSLKLVPNQERTILNQPISLDLLGSDLYYNPVIIDMSLAEFSSTLQGEFVGNIFYPSEIGKGFIKAEYKGISQSQAVIVHDNLAEIKFNQYQFKLEKDASIKLQPEIITTEGYSIPIDLEHLSFDLPESSYSIDKNMFLLKEDLQEQIINVSYKDLKTQLSLNMNTSNSIVIDDFEEIKGKHSAYPIDLGGGFNLFNPSIDGSKSGRLFYNFTKHPTETRASYYIYEPYIHIESDVNKIKLDVFGDLGKNHWLRLKLNDQNGVEHNLTLARNIDWQGWKTVEAEIPSSIKGPISIQRIYIVETDFSNVNDGLILFDNLKIEVPIEIDLHKETKYKNIFDKNMDTNYKQDNLYVTNQNIGIESNHFKVITENPVLKTRYPELTLSTSVNYSSLNDESKLILKLNNESQTLHHDNGKQWLFLKEKLKNDQSQNLIIYLSDPLLLKNSLEKKLFFKLLKGHQDANESNVFIITESNDFKLSYMEGFPIINLNMNKPFELKFNFFKSFAKFNLDLK